MATVSFTRDEVILALDVLYFLDDEKLSDQSFALQELSALLCRLPIYSAEDKKGVFRPPKGVFNQIASFCRSKKTGKRDPNVGARFYEIDAEFESKRDELHSIATAIRRNEELFGTIGFGNCMEALGFPEGALLGHLHRVIETRDSTKLKPRDRCEICQIDTTDIYPSCSSLMTMHLTIPVTALDGKKRYGESKFISVCPNCHAALHRSRPWLTKENCGDVLR